MTRKATKLAKQVTGDLPFPPDQVARRLLAWYGKAGRALPWRQTRDPYRIWLSEIMLQQTTVAAVIPYYERFLQRFPTVAALAAAPLDDVITLWAGLGYYSRARNLHQTARLIVSQWQGRFPKTLNELITLPGIGRSTAGAILAIAFDQPVAILDGNVRRVLVRLFAWQEDPRSSRADRQLWSWSEALTSSENPHDYTQAIMDLGATVCTPRAPDCASCPLAELCLAQAKDLVKTLPRKKSSAGVPTRHEVAIVVQSGDHYLLRQRPPAGLLGGLWELPVRQHPAHHEADAEARLLLAELGLDGRLTEIGTLKHAYSHFKLMTTLFAVAAKPAASASDAGYCWQPAAQLTSLPLHGAHRKAVDLFSNKSRQQAS